MSRSPNVPRGNQQGVPGQGASYDDGSEPSSMLPGAGSDAARPTLPTPDRSTPLFPTLAPMPRRRSSPPAPGQHFGQEAGPSAQWYQGGPSTQLPPLNMQPMQRYESDFHRGYQPQHNLPPIAPQQQLSGDYGSLPLAPGMAPMGRNRPQSGGPGGRMMENSPARARAGSGASYYPYPEASLRSPPSSPMATGGGAGRPRRRSRADLNPSAFAVPTQSSSRGRAASLSMSSHPYAHASSSAGASSSHAGAPSASLMAPPFAYTGMPAPPRPAATPSDHGVAGPSSHAQASSSSSSGAAAAKPSLDGISRVKNGWRYRLIVVQHPSRARMCGFGDKDRRPLSPTLIVKLIVTDEATGKDVPAWEVNTSLFFLASDLCDPDDLMASPRNVLVHHHAATVPSSLLQQQQQFQMSSPSDVVGDQGVGSSSSSALSLPSISSLHLGARSRSSSDVNRPVQGQEVEASGATGSLTTVTTESYTRNLVGAAVASANVLKDERDVFCIFFVLQDLSVRTEGQYRIKLVFADLSQDGMTNDGVSEALAEAYTEPFTVYSPRRFPGMHDPTELSKKLAAQGVKIATRSDRKKRRRDSVGGGGGALPGGEEEDEED